MNEITQIHLGRQAFTIAIDAHRALRTYLDAIKQAVGESEVVKEVELRMAELLTEHGIKNDTVILLADVQLLKEQLGDPKDFADRGTDEKTETSAQTSTAKRLFRDTDNGILAGVAAGLANYFGVDVLLVRILFIAALVTGGWGIVLYVALWLLVPEAKTSSDKLKMVGKPVTIDSLKQVIERADLKGAAERAHTSLTAPINRIFHAILKIIGMGFIICGLTGILTLLAGGTYMLLHTGTPLLSMIFPIGFREHLLLDLACAIAGLMCLFVVLVGIAIFRRKWPISAWITGALVGLFFISLALSGALAADATPAIRDRYNANTHTIVRSVQPFQALDLVGGNVGYAYEEASNYSVSLKYFGNPDTSKIKISEARGTLQIDTTQFNSQRPCSTLCIPFTYNMLVTISAPHVDQILNVDESMPAAPGAPSQQ